MSTYAMTLLNRLEPLILFLGDAVLFVASLWLTLLVRDLAIPSEAQFLQHLYPFSILFAVWVVVFFIAGLYERYTVFLKSKLPGLIVNAQIINIILAAVFFFGVPYFEIAPKTNLAIYLIISSLLITLWRLSLFPLLNVGKRQGALLINGGKEFKDLYEEINNNSRYSIVFTDTINVDKLDAAGLSERIYHALQKNSISIVVLNTAHKKIAGIMPHLYKPIYSNVRFIDANELYEDIFERIPLSSLAIAEQSDMFLHLPTTSKFSYDIAKRTIDIITSLVLGIFALVLYPFVWAAIKLEDGGPAVIAQERIGERNAIITLYKFRSMRSSDRGTWVGEGKNKVTRVGNILRKTRIDELPQLWNVLRGDISLIGPRSDIIGLYEKLEQEIPYYNLRYTVRPGLTGWAQIKQRYENGNISPQSIDETRLRLQYDLYYIKNRSLLLDIIIIFRTIKIVFSHLGS